MAKTRRAARSLNCAGCPNDVFYTRSALKARKFELYCPEHMPDKPEPWPTCPQCGDDDFGTFDWRGSVEATTIACEHCGFKDLASKHFDRYVIKITASPIDYDR